MINNRIIIAAAAGTAATAAAGAARRAAATAAAAVQILRALARQVCGLERRVWRRRGADRQDAGAHLAAVMMVVMVVAGDRRRRGHVDALHLDVERNLVLHLHDLGEGDEAVDELLAEHLLDDVLVVVVAERAAQLVVVHVVLVLPQAPQPGHLLGVHQLELAVIVGPRDDMFVLERMDRKNGREN